MAGWTPGERKAGDQATGSFDAKQIWDLCQQAGFQFSANPAQTDNRT